MGPLFVAWAVAASTAVLGQGSSNGPNQAEPRSPTTWVAGAAQTERITRVEDAVVALEIEGEAPLRLSLRQLMEAYRVPGLSVAVFDRYALVWAKGYGVTQSGGGGPVTLETLFQAASISKPVTAMAALHFVEKGRWTLDENINGRLISWKVPENAQTRVEKVTLRRLLSHTAGTTVHGFPGYAVDAAAANGGAGARRRRRRPTPRLCAWTSRPARASATAAAARRSSS